MREVFRLGLDAAEPFHRLDIILTDQHYRTDLLCLNLQADSTPDTIVPTFLAILHSKRWMVLWEKWEKW